MDSIQTLLKIRMKVWSIICTLLPVAFSVEQNITCLPEASKPGDEDLRHQYSKWLQNADDNYLHESFQLVPFYFRKHNSNIEESFAKSTEYRTFLNGNRRCRRKLPENQKGGEINTCPHYTDMSVDLNRYPTHMATAQCTCTNCYNTNRRQPKRGNGKLFSTKCIPIYFRFKVLKQKFSIDGKSKICSNQRVYDYYETYEELAVGCTCAFRNDVTMTSSKRTVTRH